MKEDSTFEMNSLICLEVIKTIKEEPFTEGNQIFLYHENTMEDLITPVTVSKEEFDQVIKKEPDVKYECSETPMDNDITSTVFV